MADLNEMSIEDLVNFVDTQELPDHIQEGIGDGAPAVGGVEDLSDDDFNNLSPEELLAIANGEVLEPQKEKEEESGEATNDELMAMLENTIGEDELMGDGAADMEIGKNIEKIKLRQLANRIGTMSPPKLFPPRKDEIYYFLTSMLGQSAAFNIENAQKKCVFIGQALKSLNTFMVADVDLTLDEVEVINKVFSKFSVERVDESEARERIKTNFRSGWKHMAKMLFRDIKQLKDMAPEKNKPIWIIVKFYESVVRSYGLARAQEDSKIYKDALGLEIDREQKKLIVSMFEDIMDISKFYGLNVPPYINRSEAYQSLSKMQLDVLLGKLKEAQRKGNWN